MNDKYELNCQAPQCGYWREESGCSINDAANNGMDICDRGEARYENQIFIVVDDGNFTSVFSDNPDIAVKVFDYDNARYDGENEDAFDEMRVRVEEIEAKYHSLY